ncbi:MAG: TolC family protein [Chitinophagales bacterium]
MNNTLLTSFIAFLLLANFQVLAQEKLSLEQVIELALENNYQIKIARNNAAIESNNAHVGNAGMLPSLDLSGNWNNSVNNIQQQFLSGDENTNPSAKSAQFGGVAEMNWTLFDGLKMFTTYKQLKSFEAKGALEARLEVENTIQDVISLYYEIIRIKENIRSTEEIIALSKERMDLAELRLEAGSSSKVEYLQARVDWNADRSALIELNEILSIAQSNLNTLLSRSVDTEILPVHDTISLNAALEYGPLKMALEAENTNLKVQDTEREIALYQLKNFKRQRSPVLNFRGGYDYAQQSSDAGFLTTSQSFGPYYGLNASVNLFNGLQLNQQIKNARITVENSQLMRENLELELNSELWKAYKNYSSSREIAELEQENIQSAAENLELAYETYKNGLISGIDFRNVQSNLLEARNRYINSRYRAKLAETVLLRLSGKLLEESAAP